MKLDLAGYELKIHEVHFAVKFSQAKAEENLTAKCTDCCVNPMSTRRLPSTLSQTCKLALDSAGLKIYLAGLEPEPVKSPSLHRAT